MGLVGSSQRTGCESQPTPFAHLYPQSTAELCFAQGDNSEMSATSTDSKRNGASLKKRVSKARTSRRPAKRAKRNSRNNGTPAKCTGSEIEQYIAEAFKVSPDVAHVVWRKILKKLRNTLVSGRSVSLMNIGTLQPYDKKPHRYRHPSTGEMQDAPERTHLRLVVSPGLLEDIQDD
jgi:nucleoid DNA-binding protein